MENYVYAFREPNAAEEIVGAVMIFASWLPKPFFVTLTEFKQRFASIMADFSHTIMSDAASFVKVEYGDDDTITVYGVPHKDGQEKVIFNVINEDAQNLLEDTVGYDKKNLIDAEKIKEFYEKCEKTGGWEPFTPSSNDQSIKSDAGKLKLTLVPPEIIRAIARARMYGLKKYGDKESWRSVSIDRYNDALCRHILLYLEDPDGVDEESGLSHLDHVACNVAFLCELKKENKNKDEEPQHICGICKHCVGSNTGCFNTCELDGSHISFWQEADACSKFEQGV